VAAGRVQVNGVVTASKTQGYVQDLIAQSGPQLEMSVRHDPASFVSLCHELEAGGSSVYGILKQALCASGLGMDPAQASAAAERALEHLYDGPSHQAYRWRSQGTARGGDLPLATGEKRALSTLVC
jgi:hypothetical protein